MMTPINSGLREGADDADYVSPYLRQEPRTLERAEYDRDCKLALDAVRRLCTIAIGTVQNTDTEQAHTEAMAIERLLARLEARDGR